MGSRVQFQRVLICDMETPNAETVDISLDDFERGPCAWSFLLNSKTKRLSARRKSRSRRWKSSASCTTLFGAVTFTQTLRVRFCSSTSSACGSVNFLTETFISLRRLENEALRIIYSQGALFTADDQDVVKVKIGRSYGIETNDFAMTVAKTAFGIAEEFINNKERIAFGSKESRLHRSEGRLF